ncbi:restriction endonuclease subunit S [Paraclostridium sordellii]
MKEGYKKTEVGVIPDDWEVKSIGKISEVKTGGTPSRNNEDYWENGTIPWMSSGEVNKKRVHYTKEFITELGLKHSNTSLLPKNTIMMALNGQGKTRGMVALLEIESTCNQSLAGIITNKLVNPYYVYYYLESLYEKIRAITGDGARNGLNLALIREIKVGIPPLKEQEKIADILSTADCQIYDTEMLIEKCQELKKGLMQRLLTKGIGHTEFKKTEVGEIPVEWEVKKLDVICEFLDGMRKPIKSSDRENMKGIIPYYGASGIIDWVNDYIFDEELILLGEDGENLKSRNVPLAFRVNGKCWVNNHAHVLRCKNANIGFVTEVLESKDYTSYVIGSAQPKLTQSQCKKILIQVPSLKEQERIAQILASIDNEIEGYKNRKQNLKKLKKGLMQQLLTGKIRTSI